MDRHASMLIKHDAGTCRNWVLLVVLLVGPTLAAPYKSPAELENDTAVAESSTVEVLRNMQKILSITRPLGKLGTRVVKQAAAAEESEGAANALAYLTDSFGGQLAGQILSVILSSVTGDVRGILGNSLNLFQTDDRRDRVQFFLDEISQNFLKITGLGLLTTTKAPATASTGIPILISGPGGQIQTLGKPSQAYQLGSLGAAGSGGSYSLGSAASGGSYNLGSSASGVSAGSYTGNRGTSLGQYQQKPQQGSGASNPIIYVLPQLNQGGSGASSGTTGLKATTVANKAGGGEDESEEDI